MRRFVVVSVVVSSLTLASPQTASAAYPPLPADATVQVPGHGWGHGRGMGQWGAKGMASAGKTWSQIVTHYYSGVTIAARGAENIRVLVERSPDVVVTSDATFTATWSDGARAGASSDTYKFLRARYDGSNYRIEKSTAWNGPWTSIGARTVPLVFSPGAAMLQLVFNSGSVKYYRGKLIARYTSSDNMRTINDLSLDHYLYGVVPRESPASWPAEALKAQSVAARTYSAYKKDNARASGMMYDICATTMCQVYGGYAMKTSPTAAKTVLEYTSTNNAINATAGKVLLYAGKPILAEYSSSTGGYSAPGSVAYQKPVPDAGDIASPNHNWTGTMKVSEIEARWPQIGRLVDITVTKRNGFGDWGGRVLEMKLVGTSATATISGYAFRRAFEWPSRSNGVRSIWFKPLYWRAAVSRAPSTVSVVQGETKTISVIVKNTGTASWPVGGKVRLAAPTASKFAGAGWISSTRAPAIVRNATDPTKSSVPPGHLAEYRVPLHTDAVTPGSYSQKFNVVADGTSTMNTSFTVAIDVLVPWVEAAPNMLRNASFEATNLLWAAKNLVTADGPSTTWARHGSKSIVMTGSAATKTLAQTVPFSGGVARSFTFGGWNRSSGTRADGGAIALAATARYTDGSTQTWHVNFPRAAHLWTYDERAFTTSASKQLASMTVSTLVGAQTGSVYFDSLRLIESKVRNASFEDGLAPWTAHGFAAGDGPSKRDKRDGGAALVIAGTGSKSVTQSLALSGARGARFLLSGWNRSVASDPVGGAIAAVLTLKNSDGTTSETTLPWSTEAHDWTFREVEVKASKSFTAAVLKVARTSQTGTQYFDDIRLVPAMNVNASFERGLEGWTTHGFSEDDYVSTKAYRDGARGLRLAGSGTQVAYQQVAFAGAAGRRFVVGGWSASSRTNPDGGLVGVRVVFRNTDGSSSSSPTSFGSAAHPWTYTERTFAAPKSFTRVDLYVVFAGQTGAATFDGVTLRTA